MVKNSDIKVTPNPPLIKVRTCPTRLPVNSIGIKFSMTKVTDRSLILCGGRGDINQEYAVYNNVFLGEIEDDDITWKQLKLMKNKRFDHVSFLINGKLYIAGGGIHMDKTRQSLKTIRDCEAYDIEEDLWTIYPHELPFPLFGAVAATSKDSSFAIITGGKTKSRTGIESYNKSVISFNDKEGFNVLRDISTQIKRYRGVSISM